MLCLSYLYCPALESVFLQTSNPDMHGDRPPWPASHSAHFALAAQAGRSSACGQSLQAAQQHAAQHLLLSLTKQWLITERHLTQYQPKSQITEDSRTLLLAHEINLKGCIPGIRTQNLPADSGIEHRCSDRPSQTVHTVSWSREPPRQAGTSSSTGTDAEGAVMDGRVVVRG